MMNNVHSEGRKQVWDERLLERKRNKGWLEKHLSDLDNPGLYLGDEMNTFHFDWEQAVRTGEINHVWRIVFANITAAVDTFAAPAVMLFYEQLHAYDPGWVVERSLCPPSAYNREVMKEDGIRPFAVESKMPLAAFDVLCLSMDLSNSAVAVPWLLMESGIPLDARGRTAEDPMVIMGGSALVNPAPFAMFCDIIFMGEGEEILPLLLSMLQQGKASGLSREEILLTAAQRWNCLYVPRFYEERYEPDGRFAGTFPLRQDVPDRIRFYHVEDLDKVYISSRPFLNFATDAGTTSHYEIARGCEGKCSFCMGGFSSLPFRVRSAELIQKNTEKIVYETGNIDVTPVSFNSVSHPEINRIVRDLTGEIGDRVRLVSMRMDGFRANPELCCFISMLKRGRIAFGVEGASQRLRDLVSKNLTESQILETMREICHSRFRIVKFMMICNLPSETEADLEELYGLAVKIRRVFEQETPPGGRIPKLLISWNNLTVSPHTPLQWAPAKRTLLPAYESFTARIRELGFQTFTPEITADNTMTQLFLRGDGRLAGLLCMLARDGALRHSDPYTEAVYEKAVRYLEEHSLPPLEDWFREYRWEDPLPWDIIESPASKQYLYRRYMAMKQAHPMPDPICTGHCSGCGACDAKHQARLREMPARREVDRKISLHHPVKYTDFVPVSYVLLEFDQDDMHAVVLPSYWDCEIRRALFHAGISFDPESIECFGSREYENQVGGGLNFTNIALGKHYDPEWLRQCLEEHAVNFHVRSVRETDGPLRVVSVTWRMSLPMETDAEAMAVSLKDKMAEEEWLCKPDRKFTHPENIRPALRRATITDRYLLITMGPQFVDPKMIFRYLTDAAPGQRLHQIPERVGFIFEKKGILDRCLTRKMRDDYLTYLETQPGYGGREDEDRAGYIQAGLCVNDLQRLIRGDDSIFSDHRADRAGAKYLPGLIAYAVSQTGSSGEDDPSLQALLKYIHR